MNFVHTSPTVSQEDVTEAQEPYPWQEERPTVAKEAPRPKGVDLFAGAGGFSLGALLAGVDIVAAVEKDAHACSTYRQNLIDNGLTNTKLFPQDILELRPEELMAKVGLKAGECHVLLGGPPCQGFSAHRLNDAGVDDPRNKLLLRYFEFVKALRPAFFIVENVPGMLWPRHAAYVNEFKRLAAAAEYDLAEEPHVLNARDYGVPQNRKRVFLFGRDKTRQSTCVWPPPATHYSPSDKEAAGIPWMKASTVFETSAPDDDPNTIHMNHGPELVKRFKDTPLNGGSRSQSGHKLKRNLSMNPRHRV